ncbi:MAK10-like protein [Tanacetum coccineum]|uniref:MAK10-like protein n=1 Tax=Tanacetum coccineum TaxID=301880 RepID=A0ABQ4Z6M8_9ASTR
MGDANPIRTLEDYSRPSYEGYMNTIELPKGNNTVPLRSDTISEIDRTAGGKLHDKNAYESWEIIENLALYDHEGWNDSSDSVKPVKAISTPQSTLKTLEQRLLELEDQINFLLKGSRATPRPSSTHVPQAYAKVVYSNPHPRNLNEPPKQNPFTFRKRTTPSPQHQVLGTTFEARVRDYMAAHTERMERFKNCIFKQREEINNRMTEMFKILKELTIKEEKKDDDNVTISNSIEEPDGLDAGMPLKESGKENEAEIMTKNKTIKSAEKELTQAEEEEAVEAPNSQHVGYYLKHIINEKLIEGLVDNHRFNDSLSTARVGKMKWKTYNLLPRGLIYEAILKKKITKKANIGGNFEIPYNIGGLKYMNALIDQGSDVNVMPLSTYKKLTGERPAETDIRLSLASHSYIYPLGIAEDVLVYVAGYVYPVDFVILNIKEDKKRPFILGTPFLTTAKAVIKFDKGTVTLRFGKSKMSFHRIPESLYKIEKGITNDIEPIAPTITVNRIVLELGGGGRIKLHQEKEMEFDQ